MAKLSFRDLISNDSSIVLQHEGEAKRDISSNLYVLGAGGTVRFLPPVKTTDGKGGLTVRAGIGNCSDASQIKNSLVSPKWGLQIVIKTRTTHPINKIPI